MHDNEEEDEEAEGGRFPNAMLGSVESRREGLLQGREAMKES